MSYDYSGLQATGKRLIDNFGRDAVLKSVTEGTYNPSAGTISGNSKTPATVKAVFIDYNESQIDGSLVQRGDKMAIISADNTTQPNTNDLIDDWKVIAVNPIQTGDTPLIYKMQVRK